MMDETRRNKTIRGVALGCVAVIMLLAVGIGAAYINRHAIARWAMVKAVGDMSQRIMLDLPDGVDRARVQHSLGVLEQRVKDGSIDRMRLSAILNSLGRALEDKRLDRQEAEAIIAQIEQAVS